MNKIFDMVETSKISAEYNGSLIVADCKAKTVLENGRFAVADLVKKVAEYGTDAKADVYLIDGVEKLYNDEGLTSFCNAADKEVRLIKLLQGDIIITTALDEAMLEKKTGKITGVKAGDKVVVTKDGRLTKSMDVKDAKFFATVLEVTSLYYGSVPAIKIVVGC